MAGGAVTLGRAFAAALGLLALACIGAVAITAGGPGRLGAADWAALRFTTLQAGLSALASVALAVPLARILARRVFPMRRVLILLLGAPFILPVIVAVLGLIAIFGRNGLLSDALGLIGLPPVSIYGLHGVVIAHVFFNLPLATRLILSGWQAIPGEHLRLAASLGFGPRDMRARIEWPMLARIVPGAAALIFLICTTSFAVALILGGGPRATTVELAIYQAFRFEFDLAHASTLALVQVGLGIAAASIAFSLRGAIATGGGLDRAIAVRPPRGRIQAFADYACIALGAGFLILPLGAVVAAGLGGLSDLPASTVPAVIRSLAVALSATALTLALALPMAAAITSARKSGAMVELMGYLVLAISPLVIGTGLFLMLFSWTDPVALALPVTALANTLVALPFAVQAILPQFRETQAPLWPAGRSTAPDRLAALALADPATSAPPAGVRRGADGSFVGG